MAWNYLMKIIDTRPDRGLEQKFDILNIPLYDIHPIEQAININNYESIIFQSPSAVKNFRQINNLENKRIIAMGPGTAKELKKFGYVAEMPNSKYNSKGVISLLLKTKISGKTLVIKGEEGLSQIADYLNSASFKTDEINVYSRVPFDSYDGIKEEFVNCDAVIFTSTLSVQLYFNNIFVKNEEVTYLTISSRIKEAINSYGQEAREINYFAEDLITEIKAI